MKNKAVLYIHGKGGSANESEAYKPLFDDCDVAGLDYKTFTPWETGKEIYEEAVKLKEKYESIILIANSIGALFSMYAGIDNIIDEAFFISPIVDMEKLITGMMYRERVTEEELQRKGKIKTASGEELSYEYLCYVRERPVKWNVKTHIACGSLDTLTDVGAMTVFAEKHNADLSVMENGEHWFHTEKQMEFLFEWIKNKKNKA